MSNAGILNTAAGSTLSIGTTATDPVTDSYTAIGKPTNLGEFGRVYKLIPFEGLDDRNTLKFKGSRDDGSMAIDLGKVGSDQGQAALLVALDSDLDYNFKLTLNDSTGVSGATPTTYYFKAKVMKAPIVVGGPNNVVMLKTELQIKSGSITEVGAS